MKNIITLSALLMLATGSGCLKKEEKSNETNMASTNTDTTNMASMNTDPTPGTTMLASAAPALEAAAPAPDTIDRKEAPILDLDNNATENATERKENKGDKDNTEEDEKKEKLADNSGTKKFGKTIMDEEMV